MHQKISKCWWEGFLEPFLWLLSTFWQRIVFPVAVCLYCMAISTWESFLLQDLGEHHSSLFFPSTILWPQISVSYKSEQALSSWGRFLINWCSGLCWHSGEILCSPEWSRLRTTEVLWSAKVEFLNMIHAQDLNTFRVPDALILTGSPETRAYKDWAVLTQALGLYSLAPCGHIQKHIFLSLAREVQILCFSIISSKISLSI